MSKVFHRLLTFKSGLRKIICAQPLAMKCALSMRRLIKKTSSLLLGISCIKTVTAKFPNGFLGLKVSPTMHRPSVELLTQWTTVPSDNAFWDIDFRSQKVIRKFSGSTLYVRRPKAEQETVEESTAHYHLSFVIVEICLLTNARRTATVAAVTTCDVFVLHAEDFRDVVDEFPAIRTMLEKRAEQRMYKLGKPINLSTVNILSSIPPSPVPRPKCGCSLEV